MDKKYCEDCGIEENEYGFELDMNRQGERKCQDCLDNEDDSDAILGVNEK